MLQALPIALQAINLFSEAQREGYDTLTRSAHAAVVRVQVRPIHPIADKANSRKFAVASYSSARRQALDNRLCCAPLGSKHPDLVAVVAPMCIKGLRLVTMQLPEKFSAIVLGTNRSSHIRVSANFA